MTVEVNDVTVQEMAGNWEPYRNELIMKMSGGPGSGSLEYLNDMYLYYPDTPGWMT